MTEKKIHFKGKKIPFKERIDNDIYIKALAYCEKNDMRIDELLEHAIVSYLEEMLKE